MQIFPRIIHPYLYNCWVVCPQQALGIRLALWSGYLRDNGGCIMSSHNFKSSQTDILGPYQGQISRAFPVKMC